MTPEFLAKSIESHDRQIGELVEQISELAKTVDRLADRMGVIDLVLKDTNKKFLQLAETTSWLLRIITTERS